MHKGMPHTPVTARSSCHEIEDLVVAFNEMAAALEVRESKLKEANEKLTALNSSYMDMLGFVSHELKSPVASIMNYAFLLRQQKVGPLTEAQAKAVRTSRATAVGSSRWSGITSTSPASRAAS